MRICIAYDCLFPWTVGGAERWYRSLAERLAADGHTVTYITLRQWDRGRDPDLEGVTIRSVGPRLALYTRDGRRRIAPPLVYGVGVLWHLLRHGRRYDVVHLASFPYFSLLAAALVRPLHRYILVADWHEVWSREYWRAYLGKIGGAVGYRVQRLCARTRHRAFTFSRRYAQRLRDEGHRDAVTLLEGEYVGRLEPDPPQPAEPVVVFAGRHIPEKRAPAVIPAIAAARERVPGLRAEVYGDGPDRAAVLREIEQLGLEDVVTAPGFVDHETLVARLRRAVCLLHPSSREGYGLVVVEAAAHGVPTIVVDGPDNAAVELISEGENGFVAPSAAPADLAAALVRAHEAGEELRRRTAGWFAANARRLSLEASLDAVLASYRASATALS
jgi:glycosyltransferase involved in cell wall biosynthesis